VLADDNTTKESGICCETAVASTHLCCCCHQSLLFQSPCTGTEQSGQRLLWLLLATQDMGASQSSVCQVETEAAGPLARVGAGLGSSLTSTLDLFQGEVLRQTRSYKEIAGLSYEEFLDYIQDLNEISSHFLDANGKQLVFAVKKGTDSTALWKGTVRVACVKVEASTKAVDSYRLLTLKQFLSVFKSLQTQTAAIKDSPSSPDSSEPSSPLKRDGAAKTPPHRLIALNLRVLSREMELQKTLQGNLDPFSSRPQCFSTTLSTPRQLCSKAPRLRSVAFASRGNRM